MRLVFARGGRQTLPDRYRFNPGRKMTKETLVDIATADGPMATYFYEPASEPRGIIILYMDAGGIRAELRSMAERFSDGRYLVLMPDLYHRMGRLISFDTKLAAKDPAYVEDIVRHIRSVTNAHAIVDTRALLEWVDQDPNHRSLPVGGVGYCMGGPFAFAVAGVFPNQFKAAASIYGVGCMTDRDDSPHLTATAVQGELYFAYAELDHHAPVTEVPNLKQMLETVGVKHEVEIYPGVSHGFAFPERPVYDASASERHWEKVLDLFHRNLTQDGLAFETTACIHS
jgi:carboxymethylenebutenolidase